uniref:DUF4939 domain-containing protein n=1 Tax=Gopherus evgoodei TaxID=1825980 RepID=A0A8C4Y0V0_9SAUR
TDRRTRLAMCRFSAFAWVGSLPSEQDPAVPLPKLFDGNHQRVRKFLSQFPLFFFPLARVGLVISLLAGKALDWASPMLEQDSQEGTICFTHTEWEETV